MEWKNWYLDLMLVPLGFLLTIVFNGWLWHNVRTKPFTTIMGTNAACRRIWLSAILKDNDKNILAVQTLRNTIMGSIMMATAVLMCVGLAAVISSAYSVEKRLKNTVYGAHGEFMTALKYVTLLFFVFSFVCHTLSIRFVNQVNFVINYPQGPMFTLTPEYVSDLLEKGFTLNTFGNRLLYAALPLLLWTFGQILVFLCTVTMLLILYNVDFVIGSERGGLKDKVEETSNKDSVSFGKPVEELV